MRDHCARTSSVVNVTDQPVVSLSLADDIFYKALQQFSRIDVFANAQNDRTVPFPSGAFMDHDPFEDWETSGLEV